MHQVGYIFGTVLLIYRHWAVMAHSEKLPDIIALGNCSFHKLEFRESDVSPDKTLVKSKH